MRIAAGAEIFSKASALRTCLTAASPRSRSCRLGACIGNLSQAAAAELGLTQNCKVGAGLIDAYGGTLGVIGFCANSREGVDRHMALIAGTSSCVTTLSKASAAGARHLGTLSWRGAQ